MCLSRFPVLTGCVNSIISAVKSDEHTLVKYEYTVDFVFVVMLRTSHFDRKSLIKSVWSTFSVEFVSFVLAFRQLGMYPRHAWLGLAAAP